MESRSEVAYLAVANLVKIGVESDHLCEIPNVVSSGEEGVVFPESLRDELGFDFGDSEHTAN